MKMTIEQFRAEVTRLRATRRRGAPKYSREMRRWAVGYARRAGVAVSKAAAQLGVSDITLRTWMRADEAKSAFEPVTVTSETPRTAALTLTTAQGHVIGPLDIESAAALLRALS